jgi:hypothetical protein
MWKLWQTMICPKGVKITFNVKQIAILLRNK